MKSPAKFFWILSVAVITVAGALWLYPKMLRYARERDRAMIVAGLPPAREYAKATSTVKIPPVTKTETVPEVRAVNLKVPFTIQAPFQVWDAAHNEACEEASSMMVDAYYRGRTFAPASAEKEILSLENWEKNRFGYFEDTNAEETAIILREYYGYKDVRVVYDFSADDIRRELEAGRPVIVPFAGRLLGNPNFRGEGPRYHMLVFKGYRDGKFVTNDPGTRRGADYVYSEATIMNAAHDWNHGEVSSGRRAMIVVYP